MDMLYPTNPVSPGQGNNYASNVKHGTTPSTIEAQNALRMEKTSLVPDNEQTEYRRTEDADDEQKKRGKQNRRDRDAGYECQTCKNRRYQDESNDSSVSFQSPTKLNAAAAGGAVRTHEQQHVSHEQERARQQGREVVSQNVVIHYDVCPECGRVYVAGGTTTTVTRNATEREKLGAQYRTGMDELPRGSEVDADA